MGIPKGENQDFPFGGRRGNLFHTGHKSRLYDFRKWVFILEGAKHKY